jgi:arylsulfatase
MVVHWPKGIKARGELRSQWHHVIDVAPTILETAGLPEPKSVNGTVQTPIEGVSLAYTFADAKAPNRHTTQYFEIFGNRAIYHDGWLAGTVHRAAWEFKVRRPLEDDVWELYEAQSDFSLSNDLAAKNPEKLKEMQALFLKEAVKYSVLPLDDRLAERFVAALVGRPDLMAGRTSLTVYDGMMGMTENVFLNLKNHSHAITAEVEAPKNGAKGVLLTQGGRFGGWSLYLNDGKPTYTYNWLGLQRYTVAATQALPPGKATIRFEFAYDGGGLGKGGKGTLFVNGKQVATGRIERTQCCVFSADEGADVGIDEGTPVTEAYKVPFKFTGKIAKVTVELKDVKAADRNETEQGRTTSVLKKALAD